MLAAASAYSFFMARHMSPTARTLALLRQLGLRACVVEQRIRAWITRDAFGWADVLAFGPSLDGATRAILVQVTSASNAASRRDKVLASDLAREWVACGNRAWVIWWGKHGKRGQRKRWTPGGSELILLDGTTEPAGWIDLAPQLDPNGRRTREPHDHDSSGPVEAG